MGKKKTKAAVVGAGAGGDDIDSILAELDAAQSAVCSEEPAERPSPRVHASFTALPHVAGPAGDAVRSFLLFGGEYYDGRKCQVFGDLFRLRIDTAAAGAAAATWSRLACSGGPKARSAHQAVLARGPGLGTQALYVFGGEYTSPSQTRFQHYCDTWRLTLPARVGGGAPAQWAQVCTDSKAAAGAPSPRSGHRAVLVEHQSREFMVVFGGFFDNGREVTCVHACLLYSHAHVQQCTHAVHRYRRSRARAHAHAHSHAHTHTFPHKHTRTHRCGTMMTSTSWISPRCIGPISHARIATAPGLHREVPAASRPCA